MDTEVKVNRHTAETIYINHPKSSYGIFCFNSVGDLFVNSDWGFYGFAWRAYSGTFKEFLAQTNAEYIVGKLSINHRQVSGKKMPSTWEANLMVLVEEFLKAVKAETVKEKDSNV